MREEPTLCPGCFLNDWASGPCARCGYVLDPDAFPTALQPGTVLSKYVVGRVLGKPGGFGITYLAFDRVLERRVALKELMPRELVARRPDGETLRVQTREDEALFNYTLTSFLNEARVIAQLSHPNVVRVLDFFEANGTAYFTMEFYEGETLAEYARRAGDRLSGEEAVALLLPLLDALDHIHSLDEPILHRDIKPANIYLTGRGAPILLDFGAARVALGQQSRSLSAVLTPGFAPFEQYSTRGNQGPWTDVYGCAATLYFLITGQAPPEASERISDPYVEPPVRLAPELSPVVSDAIVRGLGFKPGERPQSAREFAELLTGKGGHAGAAVRGARYGAPADRRAPASVAGLGSQDQPTVVTSGAPWRAADSDWPAADSGAARTVMATAPPPSARRRLGDRVRVVIGAAALLAFASVAFALTRQSGADVEPTPTLPEPQALTPEGGVAGRQSARQEPLPEAPPPTEPARVEPRPPAPRPAPAAAAAPGTGVLVIVYGEPPGAAQQAESAVLRSLLRPGLEAMDPNSLSMIRGDQAAVEAANRGDFSALARLGRQHGAEFLVVGNLSAEAVPSGGGFFTGTADMELKMYRVSSSRMVGSNNFSVGVGGAQPVLAVSESQARAQAAQRAGQAAAAGARSWMNRAVP